MMIDLLALIFLSLVLALPLLSFLCLRLGYCNGSTRLGTYILDDEE